MSRANGHLPSWARRLYKAAPRRAIVKVDAERSGKPCRITACAHLECGHTMLTKLPAQVEVGCHDNGLPLTLHLDTLSEVRCRTILPWQQCEQCQIDHYPELDVLTVSGGRVDEGHFRYSTTIEARIDAHERGEKVPPVR